MEEIIPKVSNNGNFMVESLLLCLEQEMNSQTMLKSAEHAVATCNNDTNDKKSENLEFHDRNNKLRKLEEAKKNENHMKYIYEQAQCSAFNAAQPLLSIVQQHFDSLAIEMPHWEHQLLQCMILTSAKPTNIASYASKGLHQFDQVQDFLQNIKLMRTFVQSGGPRNGNYPRALEIYHEILSSSKDTKRFMASNEVFNRLATAVALEHAEPIMIFDTNIVIDPVERYLHYESAYLNGELDPLFPTLSTWELRMVVNNDASDEEIEWCRKMLRNYRPDHVLSPNYQWRYCMIVKSDVRYKKPEWEEGVPRTYKQMISGGGMCGPRAWFGRMACKSFGIPTWGVRQPGHAAMSHWMPSNQWVICLGGPNWTKSFWDGTNGVHFDWESRARSSMYYKYVGWLKCIACISGEDNLKSQLPRYLKRNIRKNLWNELALLQMRDIVHVLEDDSTSIKKRKESNIKPVVKNVIEEQQQKVVEKETIAYQENGDIIIPASTICNPHEKIMPIVTKSFHSNGGKQVHLHKGRDMCLEYEIRLPERKGGTQQGKRRKLVKYLLSCLIVTVHSGTKPLNLEITSGDFNASYQIQTPYSGGEWAATESVSVNLIEGQINKLNFDTESLGLTIKDFHLTRVCDA